jgi:hypothetical protein
MDDDPDTMNDFHRWMSSHFTKRMLSESTMEEALKRAWDEGAEAKRAQIREKIEPILLDLLLKMMTQQPSVTIKREHWLKSIFDDWL